MCAAYGPPLSLDLYNLFCVKRTLEKIKDSKTTKIANCVGFRNYKYFLLLLIYSALSLMFITFTYWEEVSLALTNDNVLLWDMNTKTTVYKWIYLYSVPWILTVTAIGISLDRILMFAFVVKFLRVSPDRIFEKQKIYRMLSHNLTTVEFCESRDIADYENWYSNYHTTAWENYRSVFGSSIFLYPLPICTHFLFVFLLSQKNVGSRNKK